MSIIYKVSFRNILGGNRAVESCSPLFADTLDVCPTYHFPTYLLSPYSTQLASIICSPPPLPQPQTSLALQLTFLPIISYQSHSSPSLLL